MKQQFTATYRKHGKWYLGWIEEIPGVNTQGETIEETQENLSDALKLVIETNRLLSREFEFGQKVIRKPLVLSFS